jgi:hypothetical protein
MKDLCQDRKEKTEKQMKIIKENKIETINENERDKGRRK